VVKDHQGKLPDNLEQLGLLVLLFGSGLLLAALFWGLAMAIKIIVTQAIISQTMSQKWLHRLGRSCLQIGAHIVLWGSLAAFVAAIALI
jgi:hypothetical protein